MLRSPAPDQNMPFRALPWPGDYFLPQTGSFPGNEVSPPFAHSEMASRTPRRPPLGDKIGFPMPPNPRQSAAAGRGSQDCAEDTKARFRACCSCVPPDATLLAPGLLTWRRSDQARCGLSVHGLAGKPPPRGSWRGCHIGAQRDHEMKGGATLRTIFSPDPAAIGLNDRACDR